MTIKVLTNVRADSYFLDLWLRHYGSLFGRENLHVMLDGDDWTPGPDLTGVNVHVVTDVPLRRIWRDRHVSNWQSDLATRLLGSCATVVLRTDVDEFVAVDPRAGSSLPEYLECLERQAMCAALGLDVVERPGDAPLDPRLPALAQRRHAILTHQFSKLVAVRRPVRWAGGFHRAQRVRVDIGPNLLLFHLALFDRKIAEQRSAERAAVGQHHSEAIHLSDRFLRFTLPGDVTPVDLDDVSEAARKRIMTAPPAGMVPRPTPILDGNMPGGYLVRLPDRMTDLLPAPG